MRKWFKRLGEKLRVLRGPSTTEMKKAREQVRRKIERAAEQRVIDKGIESTDPLFKNLVEEAKRDKIGTQTIQHEMLRQALKIAARYAIIACEIRDNATRKKIYRAFKTVTIQSSLRAFTQDKEHTEARRRKALTELREILGAKSFKFGRITRKYIDKVYDEFKKEKKA